MSAFTKNYSIKLFQAHWHYEELACSSSNSKKEVDATQTKKQLAPINPVFPNDTGSVMCGTAASIPWQRDGWLTSSKKKR